MFRNVPLCQFIPQKKCLNGEMLHAAVILQVSAFAFSLQTTDKKKKTPWSESASELLLLMALQSFVGPWPVFQFRNVIHNW
jgi:hypothetical protein